MTYHFPADVEERVQARMATGRYASEDEVLRDALDTLDTVEADAREVQVAIDAVNEGDAPMPLNQAFDALRKKYDLATNV
jgi:Arc/MetJ-type ribon-helix-helix transcriptional regulator